MIMGEGLDPETQGLAYLLQRIEPDAQKILMGWENRLREQLGPPGEAICRSLTDAVSPVRIREGDFDETVRTLCAAAARLGRSDRGYANLLEALQLLKESLYPFLLKDGASAEELNQILAALDRVQTVVLNAGYAGSVSANEDGENEGQREMDGKRGLTERETEIVKWVAEGYKNREIAVQLGISVKTVETHRANIMNKLGLRNLSQLIRYAIQNGLIKVDKP